MKKPTLAEVILSDLDKTLEMINHPDPFGAGIPFRDLDFVCYLSGRLEGSTNSEARAIGKKLFDLVRETRKVEAERQAA